MSGWWRSSVLGIVLILTASDAAADRSVITAEVRERLTVLHDSNARYLLVDPASPDQVYYGRGSDFYELPIFGYSAKAPSGRLALRFWSPRTRGAGELTRGPDGAWMLRCGRRHSELRETAPDRAQALLERATFNQPSWNRRPYALARDESGIYYYVDKLMGRFARDFRLFVGRRGQMKEVPLEDVLRDRDGDVFTSSSGELEFFWGAAPVAEWMAGGARETLTFVPVEKNPGLIYSDLGIYKGPLGTPCDVF